MGDITSRYHKGNKNSIEAGESIDKASMRREIMGYITACGPGGATCEEIEFALNMRHQTASARCTELKALGRVEVIGTRLTTSGRSASVLVAA